MTSRPFDSPTPFRGWSVKSFRHSVAVKKLFLLSRYRGIRGEKMGLEEFFSHLDVIRINVTPINEYLRHFLRPNRVFKIDVHYGLYTVTFEKKGR